MYALRAGLLRTPLSLRPFLSIFSPVPEPVEGRAESSASLTRCGDEFVPVYNDVRPHCSLEGLTPSEVLAGMRPDNPDHLKSVNLRADKPVKLLKPEIKCTECSE